MTLSDDSDGLLLDHLRRHRAASVGELGDLLGVTATAIRQRLNRLMAEGLIERTRRQPPAGEGEKAGRGRPSYDYRLTDRGREAAGDNFNDLAQILWDEVRSIDDPAVRIGLVKRVATRLAKKYSGAVGGDDLAERMRALVRLMGERDVPVDVDESGGLPVLTMLACPYPKLAEHDRGICSVEKVMLSEVLGQGVRLSECRLDGGGCCSFEPSSNSAPQTPAAAGD
ncbi:MarR family transcriptional regulator [Botrimarina sp.]|uniref:helix-turn-helix transcriptional regulator n=1 Tax=Botrimarina sp. TaxID=2795802 RepID=UPI0032EF883F